MKQDVAISELTDETRKQLSGPALRGFFAIADRWKLSPKQEAKLLGVTDVGTVKNWRNREVVTLNAEVLTRISCLFGIFKALNSLFKDRFHADTWIRRPNDAPIFSGEPALDWMMRGSLDDLQSVRRYLEAEIS